MYDELDKRIIEELQINGRESYVELARKLGVVEGTIRKRLKRLTDQGIIRVLAVPDMRKLGCGFVGILGIQVKLEELRKVAEKLAQNPHICYLGFVTGRYDLMAIVLTQSPEELSHLIEKEISAIPSILRIETFVNLDIMKGAAPYLDTNELLHTLTPGAPQKIEQTRIF